MVIWCPFFALVHVLQHALPIRMKSIYKKITRDITNKYILVNMGKYWPKNSVSHLGHFILAVCFRKIGDLFNFVHASG